MTLIIYEKIPATYYNNKNQNKLLNQKPMKDFFNESSLRITYAMLIQFNGRIIYENAIAVN